MAQLHFPTMFRQQYIQIFKTESLGQGSYSTVYKAKYNLLPCAAKVIDSRVFHQLDCTNKGKYLERFKRDFNLLCLLKHPNIVQCFCTSCDTATGLPVLLMELMYESLTAFLKRVGQPISLTTQINICCDITMALAFLHSANIFHLGLSGENVLLSRFHQAKISDIGMSKIVTSKGPTRAKNVTLAVQVYLPPECFGELLPFTDKFDCFSTGVLAVQLMTGLFPDPSPRMTIFESNGILGVASDVLVHEIERRKSHIDLIDATHPLFPIACDCLRDKEADRPSSEIICSQLTALKTKPEYQQSVLPEGSTNSQIQDLQLQLKRCEKEIEELQKQHTKDKRQAFFDSEQMLKIQSEECLAKLEDDRQKTVEDQNHVILRKCEDIDKKGKQFHKVNGESLDQHMSIQRLQKELSKMKKENERLEHELSYKNAELHQLKLQGTNGVANIQASKSLQMTWRTEAAAPFAGKLGSTAVLGALVCVRMSGSSDIHICDTTKQQWFQAPPCHLDACSLVAVKNTLTVAGGREGTNATNMLFSLHVKSLRAYKKQPWKEQFPPMPTKRMFAMAVSSRNVLVVVGGWSGYHSLHSVEVLRLDHTPMVWIQAAGLLSPVYSASVCISSGKLYVLGGFTQKGQTKAVSYATIHSLLSTQREGAVWHRLTSLPTYRSTCINVNERLLSLGGESESSTEPSIDSGSVFEFNEVEQEWDLVSQMLTPRCQSCVAVVTERKEIMAIGGHVYSTPSGRTDIVEVASLEF